MAELCRYNAQALFAARNSFDIDGYLRKVGLPKDGLVPAGTVLSDHARSAYELAAGALYAGRFAQDFPGPPWNACKLLVSSDQFAFEAPPDYPPSNYSILGSAFSAMFEMYEQDRRLGHPDTMERIFKKLPAAGITEERHGYTEWSDKAHQLAYPRRLAGLPWPENAFLWNTVTFDWYVDEAKRHWF